MLGHLTDPKYGEEYDRWLAISFSVYHATDSCGYEAWDAWCQRCPTTMPEENLYKVGSAAST